MATTSTPHLTDSPQLHNLARRLSAWRATRRRGQRIPEALWRAAIRLARTDGVSAISSALKLGYYELQRRLRASSAPTGSRRHSGAVCPSHNKPVLLRSGDETWQWKHLKSFGLYVLDIKPHVAY